MATIELNEEEIVALQTVLAVALADGKPALRYTKEETERLAKIALAKIRGVFTTNFWFRVGLRERELDLKIESRG